MRLFEEMRGSAWTGPPPAITRPRRNSTLAPIGGVPAYCQQLVVETGVKVLVDPLTQRRTFDGVVRVTNKGRDVAALDRVGVRLCRWGARSTQIGCLRHGSGARRARLLRHLGVGG
jgi:hypothetical protein